MWLRDKQVLHSLHVQRNGSWSQFKLNHFNYTLSVSHILVFGPFQPVMQAQPGAVVKNWLGWAKTHFCIFAYIMSNIFCINLLKFA